MSVGEKGLELVKELERSRGSIPPYNEELVREVVEETRLLFEQNTPDVAAIINQEHGSSALNPTIKIRHAAIERNKRMLMAYLYNRMSRLKKYRWQFGCILPPDIRSNLSERELAWFQKYTKNLASYMGSLGDHGGLDIVDFQLPPKSLLIEVKCIKDYGDFETQDGLTVQLLKGSLHLLPRADVEPLIREKVLQPST